MDRESDGPAGIKERKFATDLNYRINALKYIFKPTLTKEKHKNFKINTLSGNGARRQRKLSRLKIFTRFNFFFSLCRYTSWYSLLNRSYLSVILSFFNIISYNNHAFRNQFMHVT